MTATSRDEVADQQRQREIGSVLDEYTQNELGQGNSSSHLRSRQNQTQATQTNLNEQTLVFDFAGFPAEA